MTRSPYHNIPVSKWKLVTEKLLNNYPLSKDELIAVVFKSWNDIFHSKIGDKEYIIGKEIFPQPQIMAFLLHELIPLNLQSIDPQKWRRGAASNEFDSFYIPNKELSFEIKTSSSDSGVFGNRSYAHVSEEAKKRRDGFILVINFEKFNVEAKLPELKLIRFGWLDPIDWIGQKSESGQQSRLTKEAKAYKLLILWESSK